MCAVCKVEREEGEVSEARERSFPGGRGSLRRACEFGGGGAGEGRASGSIGKSNKKHISRFISGQIARPVGLREGWGLDVCVQEDVLMVAASLRSLQA